MTVCVTPWRRRILFVFGACYTVTVSAGGKSKSFDRLDLHCGSGLSFFLFLSRLGLHLDKRINQGLTPVSDEPPQFD